jgi:hypothetical protein
VTDETRLPTRRQKKQLKIKVKVPLTDSKAQRGRGIEV